MLEVLFLVGIMVEHLRKSFPKQNVDALCVRSSATWVKPRNPGNFIVAMADPRVPLTPVTVITCLVGDFSR